MELQVVDGQRRQRPHAAYVRHALLHEANRGVDHVHHLDRVAGAVQILHHRVVDGRGVGGVARHPGNRRPDGLQLPRNVRNRVRGVLVGVPKEIGAPVHDPVWVRQQGHGQVLVVAARLGGVEDLLAEVQSRVRPHSANYADNPVANRHAGEDR